MGLNLNSILNWRVLIAPPLAGIAVWLVAYLVTFPNDDLATLIMMFRVFFISALVLIGLCCLHPHPATVILGVPLYWIAPAGLYLIGVANGILPGTEYYYAIAEVVVRAGCLATLLSICYASGVIVFLILKRDDNPSSTSNPARPCAKCGFNLSGIADEQCPRCGEVIGKLTTNENDRS